MEEKMFEKRCTLCGGKLDRNGICTECGLDNKKSDKTYKINQSECDHKPLTHVHTDKTEKPVKKPEVNRQSDQERQSQTWQNGTVAYSENKGQKKACKKKSAGKIISKVVAAVVILNVIIGILQPLWDNIVSDGIDNFWENTDDYIRIDPYENLTEELPAEGESVSYELTSGDYVVGVHIPEGNYEAEVSDDFDAVQVNDWEHGIYLYEYTDREDGNYLDDLRLYNGAIVNITSASAITLKSENAQTESISYQANPLAGQPEVIVTDQAVVGPDIPAGVYDMQLVSGEGSVDIDIYEEELIETKNLYMGEYDADGLHYQNLVLPENAQITVNDDLKLSFTPSEKVSTTDYSEYYNY